MDRFDFIGFHEERVEHLACLSNFMGFEISSEINLNATPFSPERAAIQSDERSMSRLRELLKVEVEFYNDLRSKWLPKLKQLETLLEHKREPYRLAATDTPRRLEERNVQLLRVKEEIATLGASSKGTAVDILPPIMDIDCAVNEGQRGKSSHLNKQRKSANAAEDKSVGTVMTAIGEQEQSLERLYELLDHTTFRNAELLKQKGALSLALEEREVRYRSIASDLQKATEELTASQASLAAMQSELVDTRRRLDERLDELESANSLLKERQGRLEAATQSLEERNVQFFQAEDEIATLRVSVTGLEVQLQKATAESAAMQREIASLEARQVELDEQRSRAQQEIQLLESRLRQRDEEISQTSLELKSTRLELEEASDKAEDLTAANAALGAQRDSQAEEIEALEALARSLENDKAAIESKLAESERWVFKLAGTRADYEKEMAKLSRRLEDEEELRKKEGAKHSRDLRELEHLRARLGEVEQEMRSELAAAAIERAEESRRHASDLAERFDEIATITRMLREVERKQSTVLGSLDAAKKIALVLQGLPWWWAMLPKSLRDKLKFARFRRRGLFDGERYLDIYPDVAAERMDPLEHYLSHGMAEGRTSAVD